MAQMRHFPLATRHLPLWHFSNLTVWHSDTLALCCLIARSLVTLEQLVLCPVSALLSRFCCLIKVRLNFERTSDKRVSVGKRGVQRGGMGLWIWLCMSNQKVYMTVALSALNRPNELEPRWTTSLQLPLVAFSWIENCCTRVCWK